MKNFSKASLSGYSYILILIIFFGIDTFEGYVTSIPVKVLMGVIVDVAVPVFDILGLYFAFKSVRLRERAGGFPLLIVGLIISIIIISFLGIVSSCGGRSC